MSVAETLMDVFNHIAFPPKLPGKKDREPEKVERDLIISLRYAVQTLCHVADDALKSVWESIIVTLDTCSVVNQNGMVNKGALLDALGALQPGGAVIVNIGEQNAALLIRMPQSGDNVVIEAFETSPSAEQTLAAPGALQWTFPGTAASLPVEEFRNPVLQDSLTDFLEKTSTEQLERFAAKARKAGKEMVERRNTVDPSIITEFLVALLGVNGSHVCPPALQKRVKDDVCWDNAELPWRRSPFWLVLRVSIQRLLYLHLGSDLGRLQYKFLLCIVLAELLGNVVDRKVLEPEQWSWLNTKLCRRLAKLETEMQTSSAEMRTLHAQLSQKLDPVCQQSVTVMRNAISGEWEEFKKRIQRKIPQLPIYAKDKDFVLSLPNSISYLENVMRSLPGSLVNRPRTVDPFDVSSHMDKNTGDQFVSLVKKYSSIAETELGIEFRKGQSPMSEDKSDEVCLDTARQIACYLDVVGQSHDSDHEQMSSFILNVLELWVLMDKCATSIYPLICEYRPIFCAEELDVLLLSRYVDLERLQKIQLYLQDRFTSASRGDMTIFSDPAPGCFADRFLELPIGRDLVQLQREIEKASSAARALKESELADINGEFESLTRSINKSICTQRRHPDGTHDIRGCSHCYYVRCRRRLEITIHEDYLPTDEKQYETRAIVFELRTPKVFSAYRSATWTIFNRFGPMKPATHEGSPQMMLRQHKPYSVYLERSNGGLTLASSTKSHLKTHYKSKSLPASASSILRPFGLTFHYYDSDRRLWAECKSEPLIIAHHFVLSLPPSLPFAKLYSSPSFAPSGSGPSSYEAIATMRECPPTVTVNEFLAHQALKSGKHRRWLTILTELGSSNINLSSLDAMVLLRHLALQVGPQSQVDPFRVVHAIFKDDQFCRRLLEQIDQHVSIIAPNWREVTYMETMLTLTIQVHNLGCQTSRAEAGDLLLKIRRITLKWIDHLQTEIRNALQLDVEKRGARYCVLAALLCRRTFFPQAHATGDLDSESFQCFIEATLAMQECFVLDISKFDNLMHSMLVRDIKMSVRLRPIVHAAVKLHPRSIASAIDKVWPTSAIRQFAVWQSLPHPHELWVTTESRATEHTLPQIIHLHILEGHFLVDGKPLGKLPADIRDSEELKELFGDQRLAAFPSNRPGMSYTLAINKEGCQIHLGYRSKALVIQATTKGGSVLEHIPRRIFSKGESFDLPEPLVRDCVHWLDLGTGILEARRMPAIWIPRPANWKLNIKTRKAQRNKKSYLVDPNSSLATAIANLFLHFERPSMLTIYQPPVKELSVELKRMNLTFHVNRRKLLQCPQLGAEIDPDQDAGTFYGLQSMLVLRNVHNRSQRSIITPLGKIHYQRHGIHVLVRKENDGFYARYMIDDILGRIHGPAEPRLLYTLAQLHAHTSFIMTDPLTARTGTEEALHILESAHAQPWSPLYSGFRELLQTISYLTPSRQYYPKGLKCLQVIYWNPALTTSIQHEAYRPIVNSILSRSHKLSLFQIGGAHHQPQQATNEPHLSARAHWRRSLYERTDASCQPISITSDTPYLSRVGCFMSKRISNVREIVTLLRERPPVLRTTQNLASLLGKWSSIGSFNSKFASTTIQETLSLDLSLKWGMLVRLCTECERKDVYHLMFHLGLIAYDKGVNMDVIRVLAAFFILPDLKRIELPSHPSFEGFPDDKPPDVETIITLARPFCKEYQNLAEQKPNFSKWHQSMYKKAKTERANHEKKCMAESESFALSILKEWPCSKPSATSFSGEILDVDSALEVVSPDWLRRFKNFQLSNFVQDAQTVLDAYSAPINPCNNDELTPKPEEFWGGTRWTTKVTLHLDQDLISKPGPEMIPSSSFPMLFNHENIADQASSPNPSTRKNYKGVREPEIAELEQIVRRITDSGSSVRSTYGQDLQLSIVALRDKDQQSVSVHATKTHYLVEMARYDAEIRNARAAVHQIYRQICDKLSAGDARHPWLQRGNIWPCITPRTILQQLRKTASTNFGPNMQQALITYGLSIVHLQRLVRMKELFAKHDQSRLEQERSCSVHASWNYMEYPDWILLEIDGNVQIRQEQVTVALEMVSPTSGSNSVLQMNMGQGKTSVIMPMVACALADCNNLVRLLVPKALTAQTAQVLQDRLGGLVGKELMHIPFSRRTPTNMELIGEYRSLHEKMSSKAGIILGVPEHALSFKLSGLQRVSDLKLAEAAEMIRTQEWIDSIARDILDECDYTLAVKTQLIYPSGSQLAVDGNPDRWEAIMGVLGLVAQHVRDLAPVFLQSIDVVERPLCSFPLVFLLRRDVEVALTERIVQDICLGRGSILPVQSFDVTEQDAIKRFISKESVDSSAAKFIEDVFRDAPRACKRTYLLRGLFVHQILLLCLKKRWNVQYGLHPGRDPMAVPFQAKGVPSDYAEWGHPDVAILFTCLAFYHEGLSQEQCRRCLQAVLKSDDPATEYDRLTQTSDLPEALRHWNLINVDDQGQVAEFWHIMRFSMAIINYFLKQFVFPVHAKQFAIKLQTSGWDVPFNSTVSAGGAKRNGAGLTTGFSGTNDNRRLLPLTIEQHDLPELLHTNAEVLTYLLQSRNREYRRAFSDGGRMSEAGLLLNLAGSEIRVLIDAGALILEMDNLTLVKTWLEKDTKAQAAVYFGTDNKPWVWYRIGKNVPLLATPYADNLQNCLVYLDEAHTRGTDLKLPPDAKGALTLGLNQTKDHTVQAAMRLRQLGTTQSIMFVAPPEVHQSILDVNQKSRKDKIDSSHVVYWLLHQTCASNAELEPLFHAQGVDFCRRIQAASEFPEFLENTEHRNKYMAILQQAEQQTLEELYKPRICGLGDKGNRSMATSTPATGKVAVYLEQLHHRRHQSDLMQSAITSSALEEVEQEREVAYEIEEEREVQRPQRLQAYGFPGLHPALSQFAMTGQLQEFGTLTAANVLHESQLSLKFGMKNSNLVPHLLVSHEFTRTVKSKHRIGDEFTRSVNWLLYNTKNETAIVIIPEEAEALIPILRTCAAPSTHLITYAAPVTRRMLHFEKLDYYTIPPLSSSHTLPAWLSFELGILAGRLYFGYTEYEVITEHLQLGPEWLDASNPASRGLANQMSFVQEWLALRRQGQDISHTPMGYICQRRPLRVDHPFFANAITKKGADHLLPSSGYMTGTKEEEYYDSDEDDAGVYVMVDDETFQDNHEQHGDGDEPEYDKVDELNHKDIEDGDGYQDGEERNCQLQ